MPYPRRRRHKKVRKSNRKWNFDDPIEESQAKFGFVSKEIQNKYDISIKPENERQKSINEQLPITKKLAYTDKKYRDLGVDQVKVLLSSNVVLSKIDMNQLWMGLFYCFWMSDKVLVQQKLAKKISDIIKQCNSNDKSLLYIKGFFVILTHEWTRIDYLRMDKFMSLVRYFLNGILDWLALNLWDKQLCRDVSGMFLEDGECDLFNPKHRGIGIHVTDIYMEELIKVNSIDVNKYYRPNIDFESLYHLLTPFIKIYLMASKTDQQLNTIAKVFTPLIQSIVYDKDYYKSIIKNPGIYDIDLYESKFEDGFKKSYHEYLQNKQEQTQLDEFTQENETKNNNNNDNNDTVWIKNYDVTIPMNDNIDSKYIDISNEYKNKEKNTYESRKNDPLLLKPKLMEFYKLFKHLSSDNETSQKHRKKLAALANIFMPDLDEHGLPNRDSLKIAIKVSKSIDPREIEKKKNKELRKKALNKSIMRQQRKNKKLKLLGLKIKHKKIKIDKRILKRMKSKQKNWISNREYIKKVDIKKPNKVILQWNKK